jgi:hypothetical protein
MPDQPSDKPWPPAEDLPDDGGSPLSGTSKVGFVLAASVLALSALFWVWAFSPWAPRGNPDRLDDRTFAEAAERICADAQAAIDGLPAARSETSPQNRAVSVAAANTILGTMLVELRSAAASVEDPDDARLVELWLADYEQFVRDREEHALRLAAGEDIRLEVTAIPDGGPIDGRIDGFARVNDMESCLVPLDV